LGITAGEDLSISTFTQREVKKGNKIAQKFIKDFEAEKDALLLDRRVDFLLSRHGIRDVNIHRKSHPKDISLTIHETISTSVKVTIKKYDSSGTFLEETSEEFQPQKREDKPSEIHFYLQGWASDDIPTLCEYCLNQLKCFVSRIRARNPQVQTHLSILDWCCARRFTLEGCCAHSCDNHFRIGLYALQ
jgi:hypothetical protein